MGEVIGQDLADLPYSGRLEALSVAGIGLWDVIASGKRRGSLDSAIRNAAANPLPPFCASLPLLRAVAFNGRTAAAIGEPLLAGTPCALVTLPSSSPANASIPLSQKQRQWHELRKFL